MLEKISLFFKKCIRVWHVLRKPYYTEFKSIAKISVLGILIIGLLGFFISIITNFLK